MGFILEYKAVEEGGSYHMGACPESYSKQIGLLTSPSYPEPYPNDLSCVYTITLPGGKYLRLNVLRLDIHCTGSELDDYIEMRDGKDESSLLIMEFCDNSSHLPMALSTSQNSLWMRYDDSFKQKENFSITLHQLVFTFHHLFCYVTDFMQTELTTEWGS